MLLSYSLQYLCQYIDALFVPVIYSRNPKLCAEAVYILAPLKAFWLVELKN